MDLLSESELNAALRKKMVEWDRQLAEESPQPDPELSELPVVRKPAASTDVRQERTDHKTG